MSSDLGAAERPTVLVMGAPLRLQEQLGAQRATAVRDLMLERALAWAESVAPGAVLRPDPRLAHAAAAQLAGTRSRGPLLIAWPELAVWSPVHGESVLEDLADGCQMAIGPVFDGGFYLLALARPIPALLELSAVTGAGAMNQAFAAAHQADLEVGLLRAERGLRTPGDIDAAVADPLLDAELRAILS